MGFQRPFRGLSRPRLLPCGSPSTLEASLPLLVSVACPSSTNWEVHPKMWTRILHLTKKDFIRQTLRAGGKGGQKQNKTVG